jgi:hypothetical protein
MGSGDILGLGDVKPSPRDDVRNHESSDSYRDTEEARRRRRMNEGADELVPDAEAPHHGSGATGIDMGSGGEGTDIE